MNKILLLLSLALLPAGAAAQNAPQRIGVAGGVGGLVRATAPGSDAAREIKSGSPLFLNDRVVTDGKGKLQLMLLDETVFTVGPNSDLTLDEFVYDPSSDSGKVSAKITKGAFRFVTGKVARKDPANMNVKLAVGTIGIRGTIVGGRADENGATVILLGPGAQNNANETAGAITVGNGNSSVFIDQPGFGVTLTQDAQPLTVTDMSQQAGQLTSELSSDSSNEGDGESQAAEGGAQSSEESASNGESSAGGEQASGEGAGEEGSSVSDDAGQNTASAGETLAAAGDLGSVTQELGAASVQAVMDEAKAASGPVIEDGISTWDQVRSIEAGLLKYSGTGLSAISGSSGEGSYSYGLTFDLEVDFGNRMYGGGTSGIKMIDSQQAVFAATNILPTNFTGLSGPAALTLLASAGNNENPVFDNSVIAFINSGGVAADHLELAMAYKQGLAVGGGAVITGTAVPVKR